MPFLYSKDSLRRLFHPIAIAAIATILVGAPVSGTENGVNKHDAATNAAGGESNLNPDRQEADQYQHAPVSQISDTSENRTHALERRNAILEAKSDLQESSYARIEILIGGLGILLTAIVVFFALRTERTSIAAARSEISKDKERLIQDLQRDAAEELEKMRSRFSSEIEIAKSDLNNKLADIEALISNLKTKKRNAEVIVAAIEENYETQNSSFEKPQIETEPTPKGPNSTDSNIIAGGTFDGTQNTDDIERELRNSARLEDWQRVIELSEGILDQNKETVPVAIALNALALAQRRLGNADKSAKTLQQLVDLTSNSESPELRSRNISAKLLMANSLAEDAKFSQAIDLYNTVITNLEQEKEFETEELYSAALIFKGIALTEMKDRQGALQAYQQVEQKFKNSNDVRVQKNVVSALNQMGLTLAALGENDQELKVYEQIDGLFAKSNAPELKRPFAQTLFQRSHAEILNGNPEAAIATLEEIDKKFRTTDDEEIQAIASMANINKGLLIEQSGDIGKALALFDRVVMRHIGTNSPKLIPPLALAMLHKGATLFASRRIEEAIATYTKSIEIFDGVKIEEAERTVVNAHMNLARIFASEKQVAKVINHLDSVGTKSGKIPCSEIDTDTNFDQIRRNPEFVKFLKDCECIS